jgi:hypothetical protein
MKLAKRSRTGAQASSSVLSFAALAAGVLALGGCGGSVYSLGNVGDGGHAEGAPAESCSGNAPCGNSGNGDSFGGEDGGPDGGSSVVVNGSEAGPAGGSDAAASGSCVVKDLSCSGGATGYACSTGYPTDGQHGLSCTSGAIEGYEVDYCCFPWPGDGGACTPYAGFPCDSNSYAYQCTPGTTPPAIDPKLSCGTNFVDSNGDNDFCCTYP